MKICFNQATTMKYSNLKKDLMLCEKYGYDLIEIRLDKLKDYLNEFSIESLAHFFNNSKIKPYAFNALEFVTLFFTLMIQWICQPDGLGTGTGYGLGMG